MPDKIKLKKYIIEGRKQTTIESCWITGELVEVVFSLLNKLSETKVTNQITKVGAKTIKHISS